MSGCPDCGPRPRWPWWLVVAAGIGTVAELAGCGSRAVTVGAVEPAPRIDLPRQAGQLSLELAGAADSFRVRADSFATVEVRDFHRTLRSGFERGFGRAFNLAGSGHADRTLVLEVSEVALVSSPRHAARPGAAGASVVLVHGTPPAVQTKAPRQRRFLQIAFHATLRAGGVDLGHLDSYAHSAEPTEASRHGVSRALASAVASLYEEVGRELFLRRTAGWTPRRCRSLHRRGGPHPAEAREAPCG